MDKANDWAANVFDVSVDQADNAFDVGVRVLVTYVFNLIKIMILKRI